MPTDHRALLAKIKSFDQLIVYLRDEMGWPIESDDLEELTFEYTPEELGIDLKNAAKIESIKRLRPLSNRQPWGIFFVEFEPKKLPVVALRRILSHVTLKKRASANSTERVAWTAHDLLFVSNYGEGDNRTITLAHFSYDETKQDLPVLKVLGWNDSDTALHLDDVAYELTSRLKWPSNEEDVETWRAQWQGAFTVRHGEIISTSKDLSINLAKLAQTIRNRINLALRIENENGPLKKLMKAFQDALIHDLDADDFADMYAQTIAYGLLSSRITNPKSRTVDDLHIQMPMTNPFLKELMATFLHIGGRRGKAGGPGIDFDELGVNEVVELLDNAKMEAVIRDFGDRNPQEDPVIHFYELFLKEYDAKKRLQRGVFYTPRPVVSYIVRSVDEILRTEFGLQDGLADITPWSEMAKRYKDLKIPEGISPDQVFVQILDPATGTGTFLVETIDLIHRTMQAKWKAQGHNEKKIEELWNEYVPKHLLPRLHGYELLMAPYAIAHLKIGLKLYETGYNFNSEERVRVYLSNSLEPASDIGQLTLTGIFRAIAHEAQAVNEIKRNQHFTVVIGNPPYSIHSGNLSVGVRSMIDRYRLCEGEPIKERGALQFEKNLQNDYVKFVRFGEMQVQCSGVGLLGYITSHAFLTNRTLRGMRDSLLETFSTLSVYNLHGNSASGEAASLCDNDENVFDITEGVAISLFARIPFHKKRIVLYEDLVGRRDAKYAALLNSSSSKTAWREIDPESPNFIFKPQTAVTTELKNAFSLATLFTQYSAGIITARDEFAADEERSKLVHRVENFANSQLSGSKLLEEFKIKNKKGWDVDAAKKLAKAGMPLRQWVKPYLFRPFDTRFIAYNRGIVWGMAFPTLRHTLSGSNLVLIGMKQYQYDIPEYCYIFVSRGLTDARIFTSKVGVASLFPLYLTSTGESIGNLSIRKSNFNQDFIKNATHSLGLKWLSTGSGDLRSAGTLGPEDLFNFIYAQLHSHIYRDRYAEFLKSDYPHIFITGNLELFRALVRIGGELIAMHLLESPKLDKTQTEFNGNQSSVIEKISWSHQTVWINKSQTIGFGGVSETIWNFHIGGYQVCEKWLKDRKGRALSNENIIHYYKILASLSETINLMQQIDEVIEQYGGWPNAFQTGEKKASVPKQGLLRF